MISKRSFSIYAANLREVILAIGLDKIGFIFYHKVLVNNPEHIGDIQNHVIRNVFEQETKKVVIKSSPKSSTMLVERICSI